MMDSLLKRIEKNRKAHIRWLAMVLCLSMIVSLGTFAGFRQKAVAKTYTKEVLDCPFTREGAEPVAHVHNDDCYDGETLVCTLPELEAHIHTDECFAEQQRLTCVLEENPGHQHGDACFAAREQMVCGLEENPGHQHTGTCFNDRGILICGMEVGEGAHAHTADCFTTVYDLVCQIPEGEGAHTHTEACYTTERVQVCGKAELPVHVHDAGCFHTEEIDVDEPDVKTVPEMPVSDPNADLETVDDWNREFENFELSGNWARDLVLVAATQQGRGESQYNFEAVLNDAGDAWVRHGYTRYGAWYGVPYAEEWSAMFVSFCLRYAGIPEENVPNNPTAAFMAESFSMGELFAGRDYVPAVGDLIFFGNVNDEITTIDHMGIVYHVDAENGTINTVEGDRTDVVATFGYTLDDEQIVGYGILPQNPDYVPTEEENNEDETDGLIVMTMDEDKEETTDTTEAIVPAVPMPAQSWERTAGGIKVTVDAPEGAFPENTTIAVTPVNGNSLKDTVSDAVSGEVLEVQAVDITFFDANGHEIEPAIPIRVVMTPAATQHAEEKTSVVHVDVAQQTAELIEQTAGTELDNSEVVFDADAFTIYAIVYTVDTYFRSCTGETFRVTMDFDENAGIPQNAELVVEEILEESADYSNLLSQTENTLDGNKQISFVRFFDISIMADGEEVQPLAPVSMKIQLADLPEETNAADAQVIHFGEQPEVLTTEAAGANVSFETASFSVYGVVYTVDFEYTDDEGKVFKWSWPGEGSYSIASILAEFGVTDEISDVTLERTVDEGGAENALYLEKKEDVWYLTSEVAFHDVFELSANCGTKTYLITVTDAEVANLTSFITAVNINAPFVDGKYEVRKGKPITIDLTFKEKSSLQFNLEQMTYPIPAGLEAVEGVKGYLTITATDGDETYTVDGNEYEVIDGVLILKWNTNHPDFEHVAASKNTEINLHISASLDGTNNQIDFGGGITKDFTIEDPHGVSVQKTSFNLNKQTGEVEYLISVTSTGDNTNIVVTDNIPSTSRALSNVKGSVKVYSNKDDRQDSNLVPGVSVNSDSESGFSLTIPSMKDGQTYGVYYKGQVDLSKLTRNPDGSYGIDSDTLNNVTAKPEGYPEDSTSHTQGKIYAKPEVNKKAGAASDVVDGKRTVEWTMTATSVNTPDGQSSLAGGWIKDTIDNSTIPGTNKTSQDIMKYSGSGIKVVITNEKDQVVDTRNISWTDLGVNPSTATSWTYNVPNSGIDKTTNGKLTYTITYTTEVDVSEMISEIEVKNEGDSNKGDPHTGKGGVGPVDGNEAGVDKKVINVDREKVEWQVDITVPAAGLTVATLEDIFPKQWEADNAPYDSLKNGSITYEGLLNGENGVTETKTEDTSDPKKMLITFGYTDSNGAHSGLYGTGEQRTVTVKFTTNNNADWITNTDTQNGNRNHVNTARFTGNQKVFTDTATAVPTMEQKVTKRANNDGFPSGKINVNGVDLPVWTYELVLEGVLPDSEITDTFDNRLVFVPFNVVDFGNSTTQPGVLYGGETFYDMQSYVGNYINTYGTKLDGYVDAVSSGNEVTFHIYEDTIPKYSYNNGTTDVENQYFKIIYQLRAKDEASLESLMAEAAAQSDKTLNTIKNTAVFGPSSSELNVKYKFSPVTKELINSGEIGGLNNIAKFKIVVNPSGLDLDPSSDFITLTDKIVENLSIEYDSIKASPSQGVKWTFNNNIATYTIPDGIPLTITYDALIIGNGNVHFRNEATFDGETVFVDETKNVQSKADGLASNPTIKVKKHKEGEMTTPLAGAEFQLYEFVCADGKTADECWRVEVPGTNPVVHGLDRDKLQNAIANNWGSWQLVTGNTGNVTQITDANGVATFHGDEKKNGWALTEGELYALYEIEVPEGYEKEDIYWSFVISENGVPYYDYGIYHSGDAMRIANTPKPGITIEKEILGANLTDEQKAGIVFEITNPKGGKTTLTFNQFTHGEYRITGNDFVAGTYTIVEKTTPPAGYGLETSISGIGTGNTVTENEGQIVASTTVTIPDTEDALKKDYTVSFLNKYSSASINVVKIGEKAEYLEGAVFELFKKDTETGEEVSKGQKTSTSDAAGLLYDALEDGDYILREIAPPEGYLTLASDIKFKIVEGAVQWIGEDTASGSVSYKPSTKTVTVLNREDTRVVVNKVWAGEDDKATPVTMKLYRTSMPLTFKTVPYKDNNQTFGNVTFPVGATIKAYFNKENGEPDTAETTTNSGTPQIHIGQNNISNVRLEIILPAEVENSKRLVDTKQTENNTVLFEGLDRTDPAGNLYTYWVEEETPTGRYTVSYEGNYITHNSLSNVITVTNTPEEEQDGLIEVEKVWKNTHGDQISDTSALPEITLQLKAKQDESPVTIHVVNEYNPNQEYCIASGDEIHLGDSVNVTLRHSAYVATVSVRAGNTNGEAIVSQNGNAGTSQSINFTVTNTAIYIRVNSGSGLTASVSRNEAGSGAAVKLPDPVTITLNNSNRYYWNSEEHPEVILDTSKYAYYVEEESVPVGYEVSYSNNNEAGVTKGKLTVTNTESTPQIGSVKVTKNFTGITADQIPAEFKITATWTDAQRTEQTRILTISGTSEYDDVTKEGSGLTYSWTINNLPLDPVTTVKFEESGYDVTGYTVTINSTATASAQTVMAAAEPGEATFNNDYTRDTGSMNISKSVTVNGSAVADTTLVDGDYTFTVTGNDDATTGNSVTVKVTVTDGVVTTAELVGTPTPSTVTVEMADGKAKVSGLPTGAYTVAEDTTGLAAKGVTLASSNNIRIIVEKDQTSSIPTASFINNKDVANLKLSKTVEGATDSNEIFSFNVTLTAPDDMTNFNGSYPTVSTPNGGTAADGTLSVKSGTVFTVELKAGDTWEIKDLPKGTKYIVTEGELPVGWTLTSSTNPSGTLSEAGVTAEAAFTNTYSEVTKNPQVTKLLKGRDWKENETFIFTLAPYGEDTTNAITSRTVVMPDNSSAVATKDFPTASFGDITFKDEGTFFFTIKETAGDDDDLIYSKKEVRVKVVVTKTDGVLSAVLTYADVKDDAGNSFADVDVNYVEAPKTFTNTQKPGDLKLTKKVVGQGGDATKAFEFKIELTAPEDGTLSNSYNVVKTPASGSETTESKTLTWAVEEEKTLTYQKGSFTMSLAKDETIRVVGLPAGTTYTIEENDYSQDGYSPATTKGSLTGTITGGTTATEEVEVTNTYGPGKLVIEKVVGGTADNAGKSFSFEVVIARKNNGNGPAGSYSIGETTNNFNYSNGTATVTFEMKGGQKAEFSVKDKNVSFTVKEISADKNGFVTTVKADGATVNTTDKTVSGNFSSTSSAAITIQYTNTRDKTSAEAIKVWKSGETTNTAWPDDVESVDFTLYKTVNNQTTVVDDADLTNYWADISKFENPISVSNDTQGNKAAWDNLPVKIWLDAAEASEGVDAVSAGWYDVTYSVKETKVTFTEASKKTALETEEAIKAAFNPEQPENTSTIINTLPTTGISVTKQWKDGTAANSDRVFTEAKTITFTLYQKLGDKQGTVYTAYGEQGKGTVTYIPASDGVPASWSMVEINDLPKYVYDTASGKWIMASYYVVEDDSTGVTIAYKIGEGDAKSSGDEAIVGPDDTDRTITIINTDNLVNLDIVKVDSNDPNKKLTGAKFQMRKQNGSMWEAFENKAFSVDKDKETGPFEITSEVGITIYNLVPGTYQVTEIDAPAGYIVSNNVFTFKVPDTGVVSYENGNELITFTAATESTNAQFRVANVAGTQLPQTGGVGTTLFMALGGLMTATAGAILTMKSYRRRKENA